MREPFGYDGDLVALPHRHPRRCPRLPDGQVRLEVSISAAKFARATSTQRSERRPLTSRDFKDGYTKPSQDRHDVVNVLPGESWSTLL